MIIKPPKLLKSRKEVPPNEPFYRAGSAAHVFSVGSRHLLPGAFSQVAQPDGSTGADEELGPGDVFVVPRFFPLVQKVREILYNASDHQFQLLFESHKEP